MDKEGLTNEKLRKKFKSQFDLVGYAIKLADNMIMSGRGPRVRTETQNPAMQVLAEIAADKDQFDVIVDKPLRENNQDRHHTNNSDDSASGKSFDKKRNKKIFAE